MADDNEDAPREVVVDDKTQRAFIMFWRGLPQVGTDSGAGGRGTDDDAVARPRDGGPAEAIASDDGHIEHAIQP